MAKTDPKTIIDINQDPGLTNKPAVKTTTPSQVDSDYAKANTKVVVVNYTDPPLYGTPELQIFNDPGGANGQLQFNQGNRFAADNGLSFNSKTRTLSILGNLRVTNQISGRITTNSTNFKLTGGNAGQVLETDGYGNLSWVDQNGGSNTYGNSDVASYLPTYTGNLLGSNISITDTAYLYNISSTGTATLTTLTVGAHSNLGNISNVTITGGTSGQTLATDGAGNLHWSTPQAGPQGPQGSTGAAGNAATITVGNVATGAAGTSVIVTNSGDSTAAIFDFTIPRGDHGETGPQGDPGVKGDKGDTGDQGPAGANGAKGDKGDTGSQGVAGPTGAQGAPGEKGDKGDTGDQGVSVTLIGSVATPDDLPIPGGLGEGYIVSNTGNLWFWNSLTTSWNDIGQIVGPQGDQGPAGATGSQGAQGEQGVPGTDGQDGISFVWKGAWDGSYYVPNDVVYYLGSTYICTVDNLNTEPTNISYWELMATKGDQGLKGDTGDQGPRGYGVNPGGATGQVLVKSSDTDYDTVWQDPSDTTIHISDLAPSSAVDGTVWWSSEAGRSYIKYNDQWVDMSPQTVQPDAGNPFDQDLNTNDNVTFNDIIADNVTFNDLDVTTGYIGNANIENLTIGNSLSINNLTTGNVTANYFIGDGSQITNLPIPPYDNTIIISEGEPSASPNGTLWFNSDIGKTYIKYDDQWVDSNPQTIDARAIRINDANNIEAPKSAVFTDGRVYQDYSNGFSSIRWTSMTSNTEMLRAYSGPFNDDDEQNERGKLGLAYQGDNVSGLYITSFDNEDEKTWTFEGTGNLRFPDDTIQTTAYRPATLLDGGGANSTYTSNVAPGSIPNPFDQELNTNDIVQFANVTASYFIGDGSQLTNLPSSNVSTGAVTFSNQTVIGTGDIYGTGGLYLAQGPESVANLQYFRIRGGDTSTHLHFDTGNNAAYDQYFGDDFKYLKLELGTSGNVVVGTNYNTWTFGIDGNLTLPTNTSAINYANGSPLTAAVANTTTDNFYINGEGRGLIVDTGGLKRFGFMKYYGIEGSLVHSAHVGNAVPLRIGRTSTQDVTAANVDTFTTEIYIGTNGHVRIADDNVNDINDPTERLEVTGNIKISGSIKGDGTYNQPNFLQINFADSGWAYGAMSSGPDYWMQTKFYGQNQANRGFRVLESEGNTVVFSVNGNGDAVVSGNITADNIGNIAALNLDGNVSNVLAGNGTWIAASGGSSYSNSDVSTFLASFGSNTITTTGTVAAGILKATTASGDEGGEINLTKAPNSTLSGNIVIDQYIDRVRIFDGGGTSRGVYIDLAQASAGVGTLLNNRVSSIVNAGTFVTMDLLKVALTSTGNRGLTIASTTGSFTVNIGATYSTATSSVAGSAAVVVVTTTPSTSLFSWNFLGQADTSTYIFTDITNNRAYRVVLQIGASYNNNLISIERLV